MKAGGGLGAGRGGAGPGEVRTQTRTDARTHARTDTGGRAGRGRQRGGVGPPHPLPEAVFCGIPPVSYPSPPWKHGVFLFDGQTLLNLVVRPGTLPLPSQDHRSRPPGLWSSPRCPGFFPS